MPKFSPMLAARPEEDMPITFPCLVSPKIDGIRALIKDGVVLSRSGKPIPNQHVQRLFGHLHGYDGELVVGSPTASDCFRASQAVMGIKGVPDVRFYIFDRWDHGSPYLERFASLRDDSPHVQILQQTTIHNHAELDAYEAEALALGYEGVMLRNPHAPYKHGRSTVREGYLLKIKRFADAEAAVTGLEEQKNLQGDANGVLGALHVRDLATGIEFSIGAGFTESERVSFWQLGRGLLGSLVRYRYFPVGMKEKPRFPIFSGLRSPADMVLAIGPA